LKRGWFNPKFTDCHKFQPYSLGLQQIPTTFASSIIRGAQRLRAEIIPISPDPGSAGEGK
jgi:hypothetical protein